MEISSNDDFMTMDEMVKYIRISRYTLIKLIKAGEMPATKIGDRWFFSKKIVEEFVTNKMGSNK